ncbi:MAG: GTPase-associated system all-helical protein GASH [Byssovorax sp.]
MTMTPKKAIQHAREKMGLAWTNDEHVAKVTGVVADLASDLESPETVTSAVQALWLPTDCSGAMDRQSIRRVYSHLENAVPTLAQGEAGLAWVHVVAWAALSVAIEKEPRIAGVISLMRSATEWSNTTPRLGELSKELTSIAFSSAEAPRAKHTRKLDSIEPSAKKEETPTDKLAWDTLKTQVASNHHQYVADLAKTITELIEITRKQTNASKQKTASLASDVRKIEAKLTEVEGANQSGINEANLLWWGQSLYSPNLRRRYRDIPANQRVLWMAYDLAALADIWPSEAKAAYFSETLRRLNPDLDTEAPLRDHATRLIEAATLERDLVTAKITNVIPGWIKQEATCFPIGFILNGASAGIAAEKILSGLVENVGVNLERPTTHQQWATWVHRELCLHRFLGEAWQTPKE